MANFNELLEKLNPEQKKPVLDTEGAVLVIAGAGSGKTRVLTMRIAYLVKEKGVNPSNIMAITFTNKAANEMKERLIKIIGDIGDMWVSTIHSMCVKILRRDIDKLGFQTNFTIYDETDKDRVLKRIIESLSLDVDKYLKNSKNIISTAKNDCISADDFRNAYKELHGVNEYASIYGEYESQLKKSNCLDFDDLLFKTYELFLNFPDTSKYYSDKFQYIHIDEFQDTNKVQFFIAQKLSESHRNIFVVGDDDQSIYGWRGAKIENILSFDEVYTNTKIYKLEQNYRSTKKILDLANCIIANNTSRREKKLWTENGEGAKIESFVGTDENNEATFTAIQIKNLMARSDLQYKDFAVFMRLNALSRAFEQEFTKYGIPYRVYGGFRFFERKEIKDVLSYLKLVNNSFDDESFLRCISTPKRGIGDKTLQELREFASANGLSLFDSVDRIDYTSITSNAKKKIFNFKLLIESFKSYSQNNSVANTIEYVLETTGFMEQFAEKTEENVSRIYNISELKNSAEQFEKDNSNSTLSDYLNSVTLSTDTDSINDDNAVTIATIHAVKGLEYKCVFVSGLDEKILPINRAFLDESEMEEERRLMYVAITRARERLYLTRATSRYLYGSREFMTQSRFLKEAQPVLSPNFTSNNSSGVKKDYVNNYYNKNAIEDDSYSPNSGGYSSAYAKKYLNSNKPVENLNKNFNGYKCGTKVKHAKFGEGTVIMIKGEGENIIASVAFKGVGIKELSIKYAPMEII
ncbi:MAG: UvrD-helicase domain-containing protein [Clostridia bacterium]|nr:UvrD-helicase domain-containing protein [Clostridia bacterium]